MITFVFQKLAEVGINDIILVIRKKQEKVFKSALDGYEKYGVKNLSYAFDPPHSKGLVNALYYAKGHFKADEDIMVTCSDVLIDRSIKQLVDDFREQKDGARLLGLKTNDTAGFSKLKIKEGSVLEILPKDKESYTPGVIDSGTYIFKQDVFKKIEAIKKNKENPEIWELNKEYIKKDNLFCTVIGGWWSDVGNSLETFYNVRSEYENT